MLESMKKDANYIWDVQAFAKGMDRIGNWNIQGKLCHSEYDISFTANESWFGCEGVVRVNRFATGRVGQPNRRRLTWRMMKLKGVIMPYRRFSGNSCTLKKTYDHIENEQMIYWKLSENSAQTTPPILDFGFYDGRAYIVFPKLPDPLYRLSEFPLTQIYCIGIDLVNCLQHLHRLGYVHRNLNFNSIVYSKYPHPDAKFTSINLVQYYHIQKIPKRCEYLANFIRGKGNKLNCYVGTCLFASMSAHELTKQTRRDDLISMVFVLIYLLKKNLPWEEASSSDNWKETACLKREFLSSYHERNMPKPIATVLDHILKLNRFDKPDYSSLKEIFKQGIKEEEIEDDDGLC